MTETLEPLEPVEGYFTDLGKAVPQPPRWVVEPILPEGLVIMAGPPKEAYKSTIVMALACLVTRHEHKALPPEWQRRVDGPVMILSHEADAGELRFIVEQGLGVKLRKDESILVADRPEDFRLDEEEGHAELMRWLHARQPILTVIDPLANFHSLEEKDAGQMVKLLAPLRRWAKEEQACILVVHHTRKLDEERLLRASDVRGSSAMFGLADGLILLSPTKAEFEVVFDVKPKRGKHFTQTVQLGIWDRKGQQGRTPLVGLDKLLVTAISLGFVTVEEAARHCNVSVEVATKRLANLARQGRIVLKGGKAKVVQHG